MNILISIHQSQDKNKLVAIGNNEGEVFLVDYENGKRLTEFNCHSKKIRGLCFSNDSMKLLTGSDDGTAKLVDLTK